MHCLVPGLQRSIFTALVQKKVHTADLRLLPSGRPDHHAAPDLHLAMWITGVLSFCNLNGSLCLTYLYRECCLY